MIASINILIHLFLGHSTDKKENYRPAFMDHFDKQDAQVKKESDSQKETKSAGWPRGKPGGSFQSFIDGDFDFVSAILNTSILV